MDEGHRSALRAWAQLAALSSFVFAQPLFASLGPNAEFFVVRGSARLDILVLAVGVVVVPPTLLLGVELLAGLVGGETRSAMHLVFIGLLAGTLALEVFARTPLESSSAFPLAALVGVSSAALFARFEPLRTYLTYLAPAALVFLGLFLLASPVSRILFPATGAAQAAPTAADTPVVLVVFDEFPLVSLLDGRGEVDSERYPEFARLAAESTWYRWTSAPSGDTTDAVPAILTGRLPDPSRLPFYSDHPHNLFTLLGRTHAVHAVEPITRLCPARLCPRKEAGHLGARLGSLASDVGVVYLHTLLPRDQRDRLPSLVGTWVDFGTDNEFDERAVVKTRALTALEGRVADLRRQMSGIRPTRRPGLHVLHVLLPHHPWEYLPSGGRYARPSLIPGLTEDDGWGSDSFLVQQAWQRHLLQVGFVDRLLGELVDRLRQTGLYARTLLVVTADHGVAFQPNVSRRRLVEANRGELALVPFFVKAPGQTAGRVVESHARTVDVLPTVASVLDVDVPWAIDGVPAGRETAGPSEELRRQLDESLARKERLFGSDLYRIGPQPGLLGRPVSALALERLEALFLDPGLRQPHVVATVEGVGPGVDLLVASDGKAAAFARTFSFAGKTRFEAMLPPWAAGSASLAVFRL